MIIFRAIGVSLTPTDRTTLVGQIPLYEAVVDIVEIRDRPASTKVLQTVTLDAIDVADLAAQCAEILTDLKRRQEAAQVSIDIVRKTLAEATVDEGAVDEGPDRREVTP